MKKIVVMMLALSMALVMAGCAGAKKENVKKVGGISLLNVTEEDLNKILKDIGVNQESVFFEDLDSMVTALESGKIDEADVFGYMAEYAASRNDKLTCEYPENAVEDSMKMAVREEDSVLLAEINGAIADMKADGTLDALMQTYIMDVINGSDPETTSIETIEGAETIKVAVTGSCAPFDYMDAAGNPAGYNVAVLSELSQRIHKNIELVNVTSAARSAALASKKVDVLFWILSVRGNDSNDLPSGMSASDAFCTTNAAALKLK